MKKLEAFTYWLSWFNIPIGLICIIQGISPPHIAFDYVSIAVGSLVLYASITRIRHLHRERTKP